MATRLDFVYDPDTGAYVHRNSPNGGNGMSQQDPSSWIQNIAYDYQGYIGGSPTVSTTGTTTAAPSSGGTNTFWNILNGISGAIDGIKGAAGGYVQGQYNPPLNPQTPYYNQYGVPFNPGAPGTSPGPTSGFVSPSILPGVSDSTLLFGLLAVAGIIIAVRSN